MPGRKSIVLLSDGFTLFGHQESNDRVLTPLRRLVDLANRASVVIYTIDARGLQSLDLTAAEDTSGLSSDEIDRRLGTRREEFLSSQESLSYLAQETGGFFTHNNNDLDGGLRRVLEDQNGYYLIGYRPDDATFDRTADRGLRFHHLEVRIKRPGVKVRYRKGFYGIVDEDTRPTLRTRTEQLAAALTSPFSSGDVRLRLTSIFRNEPQRGSFVRSLLFIDGHDITFTPEADGGYKANVEVVALTFGDNGNVLDQIIRAYAFRARGDGYQSILNNGLIYTMDVPVKKPGAYQLRVAIRDAASEHVGSASQFVEVPNLNKKHLSLSGLVLNGTNPTTAPSPTQKDATDDASLASNTSNETTVEATNDAQVQAGPAVRRVRREMDVSFFYLIYNAQLEQATRRPQLETQVRLFRDGNLVFEGQPTRFNPGTQTDFARLRVAGHLKLNSALPPGEYVLQVIATDTLVKGNHRVATQWSDFEIVK